MPATTVIGREGELGAIQAFVAEVDRGPSALVLSGEPGIGKTVLWEAAVAEAQTRAGRVLTCRGVEAEASLSFAGLSELIAPVLEEVSAAIAPPRRRALEVALLLAEPGDVAPDAHVIGLAVLDVLRALTGQGPVVVALDDAQWLDPASAGVLQIALRRLRDEPIGLLATLRVARETATPRFQLDHSFPDERLHRLSLGPLSAGALHRLLVDRLALELTRPELARVSEASAGNPFFALELGRELVRTATRPAPGQALRVPESLRELLGGRLSRLPGETLDVLLQVAALARPTVELVAAAHGDGERVLRGLEAAVREGVVELDGSRVRFTHPLLTSICYEEAPLWKRRAVHRALAAAVADVEERARHLALAADGPDAVAASYLDAAADQAAARGATAAAAELCELAAELTPDDPPLARRRRLRAANFHRLAGEGEQATALLDQLLTEVPPGVERADVLFALAHTFRDDPPTTNHLLDEALAQAAGDEARAARILGFRSLLRLLAADVPAALVDARAALEKAERVGDPALLAFVISRVGHAETWAGEITPGLLERGAEIEERLGLELEFLDSPRAMLTRLLMRLGEVDRTRVILEELEATAGARGDERSRVLVLWYLVLVEWYAGRWQRAMEYAAVAHELGEQTDWPRSLAWVGRVRALLEADLGLVEAARSHAEAGLVFSQSRSDDFFTIACLGVLGRLELALGDLEAARGYLRELPGRLLAGGVHDPANPVWPDTIETLITLGDLEQAHAYLDNYEQRGRQLESPWAVAAAARCRGLLSAAEGDPTTAFAAFQRSLVEGAAFPLEHARTLLCLGVVRRQAQQKKAAREALEKALAIFEELGARLWAEKARAELRRISGRRAPTEELTETERRVAELAAQGRSNREIAAELFMGVSTVEAHLSRVYRKLDIRSRAALAGRLAMPVDAAAQR
jgi:DNA-binding CsgD family transcriptional regulator